MVNHPNWENDVEKMVLAHNLDCQISKKITKFVEERKSATSIGDFQKHLDPVIRGIISDLKPSFEGTEDQLRNFKNSFYQMIVDTIRKLLTDLTSINCTKKIDKN